MLRNTQSSQRTVTEIRSVFPDNLQRLCEQHGNVSGLCRELDLNRTQFMRYLNGTSSPRPEVLERICSFFNVDARILLVPLDDLQDTKPSIQNLFQQAGMDESLLSTEGSGMQDGFYRYWKVPFSVRGKIYMTLAYVSTVDGVKRLKTIDHRNFFRTNTVAGTAYPQRRSDGFLFNHLHGHSFFLTAGRSRTTVFGYLENSYGFNNHLHYGYTGISNPQKHGARRISNIVFEKVNLSWAEAISEARRDPFWEFDKVHPSILPHLAEIPDPNRKTRAEA